MDLSTLPDDVLVHIGTSVAKLCGIKDYVTLSKTSRRINRLLMDQEATIPEVIRIKTSFINQDSSVSKLVKSSLPAVWTLEQLSFYEYAAKINLLQENRIYGRYGDPIDYAPPEFLVSNPNRTSQLDGIQVRLGKQQDIDFITGVQAMLKHYPKAEVVLEAHSGTETPDDIAKLYAIYRGDVVRECMALGAEHLLSKFTVRGHGSNIANMVAHSSHPYSEVARKGLGWVEVYVRLPGHNSESDYGLELPPRPIFYDVQVPDEKQ